MTQTFYAHSFCFVTLLDKIVKCYKTFRIRRANLNMGISFSWGGRNAVPESKIEIVQITNSSSDSTFKMDVIVGHTLII